MNNLRSNRRKASFLLLFFIYLIAIGGCSANQSEKPDMMLVDMSQNDDQFIEDMLMMDDYSMDESEEILGEDPLNCDPLLPDYCALPWPSDHFLKTRSENTNQLHPDGQYFTFQDNTLPTNFQAKPFSPRVFENLDGYGLLSAGMVYFENLDESQLPNEEQIEQSLGADAVVVLLKITKDQSGQISTNRVPCWAELDLRADPNGPQTLFLRPAQLLEPSQDYAYALIDLKDEAGHLIEASPAFQSLRDGVGHQLEGDAVISKERRLHFEELFQALDIEGFEREKITLAWRFRTASSESLTGNLVQMRDEGLRLVNELDLGFEVNEIIQYRRQEDTDSERQQFPINQDIAAEIRGYFTVPNFMENDGTLGGEYQLHRNDIGKPSSTGTTQAPFWLRIPYKALNGEPMGIIIYGHGQLYSGAEVQMADKSPVAQEYGYVYLGTDLWGMSENELSLIPQVLNQMDRFTAIADRLHQGILNHLVLARLAKTKLEELSWIIEQGIQFDMDRLVYGGISQGGIFGATIIALSQDMIRGHLGVPGLDYFTLIGRSRNFSAMFSLLSVAYADPIERWICLAAAQLLWNTTDPSTYYRYINFETLPDTPPHQVLLTPAQGDPQVSQLTIEHIARSHVNIPILTPYGINLPPLSETGSYPHRGSGIVGWHYGPRAPIGAGPAPSTHHDPHDIPRADALHNEQMNHFWATGEIIDLCGGELCGNWSP